MRPLTAGKRREALIRRRVEFIIKYPALVRLNRQMLRASAAGQPNIEEWRTKVLMPDHSPLSALS